MLLRLAQIQAAYALDRPQKIALGDNTAVFSVFIEHRQRRIAGAFHAFHRLPQRIVRFDIGAHRLRRQEKKNIHASASLCLYIISYWAAEGVTIL